MTVLWGLAGCTTVYQAADPVRQPETTRVTGTVIVSLSANTLETRAFDRITLTRLDAGGERQRLVEHREALRNVLPGTPGTTTVFVGAVAPGDYQLRQLSSANASLTLPETVLGSFSVHADGLTDLGRLVLTSVNDQAMVGRSVSVTDNETFVARHSPNHVALYRQPDRATWHAPDPEQDAAEAYARHHPLGMTAFRRLADGQWIGGAHMGTLLLRVADGQWRSAVMADEMESVTAVVPDVHDGSLAIAGTDLGSLLRLLDNGVLQRVARGNLPRGRLAFLDRSVDRQIWVAGVHAGGLITFFASPRIDRGQWTPFGVLETPGAGLGRPATRVWTWHFDGGFGFAASSDPTLSCFDYASGMWRTGTAPGELSPVSMLAAESGALGLLVRTPVKGAEPAESVDTAHVSGDCGQTWQAVTTPADATASAPLPMADGTVLRVGRDTAGDAVFVSADGGQTWQRRALDAPVLRERLWLLGSTLLAVTERQGVEELRSSRNGGARWTVELTRVNPEFVAGAE